MISDGVAATAAASGRNGKFAALRHAGMLVCLLLLASAVGCAPKLYNVNMRYQPTKAIQPVVTDGREFSLTVASFLDNRKMADTLLIGRVVKSDDSVIPILPKYAKAADAVASALRELLIQSGYGVSPEKAVWDLQEGTIRPDPRTRQAGPPEAVASRVRCWPSLPCSPWPLAFLECLTQHGANP